MFKYEYTRISILIFSLMSFGLPAQDLTGVWRGHFKSNNNNRLMDSLLGEDRYKFEAQINQTEKKFEGVTYSYKTTVFLWKGQQL